MSYIKRTLFKELENHLEKKEVTLLLGPRQVGKTTLLKMLMKSLQQKSEKVIFLNLDIESDFKILKTQAQLLNFISLRSGGKKCFVFIDEIQRKDNAGRFIKGIYDQELNYKFILGGSGSLELKEDVVESLAGRKRVFELNPVSFPEYIDYKTSYEYSDSLVDWMKLFPDERGILFEEYLIFGGYPDVVISPTIEEKKLRLKEIYRSYIDRDINSIVNIEKPQAFSLLFQLIGTVVGHHINYSALSKKIGISEHTVKQYLWYMEKTFMISLVRPFYQNAQKEIIKSPQIYFKDLGIFSFAINNWEINITNTRLGMAFQNFVYNELRNYNATFDRINYWRTKDGAEVDIVMGSLQHPVPYGVKYSHMDKGKLTRGLRRFIATYHPKNAYLINLSHNDQVKYQDINVEIIPFWQLGKLPV